MLELTVPDLGGFGDVPVIEILVQPGERIEKDAPLVTLESDKATMEVPASASGVVKDVRVKLGDKVSQGSVLATIESEGSAPGSAQSSSGEPAAAQTPATPATQAASLRADTAGIVAADAGATEESAAPPTPPAAVASSASLSGSAAPQQASPASNATVAPAGPAATNGVSGAPVHAAPALRRFARELGVDLHRVRGSGPNNRITREDVQRYVKSTLAAPAAPAAGAPGGLGLNLPPWPSVDFAKYGPVERVPLTRIQRISGPALARNWVMIPHVTQNEDADVTELEAFRKQVNAEQRDVKLTMLTFLIRASVDALKRYRDLQRLARRRRAGAQALLPHRLRRRHAAGTGRPGDPQRRREGADRDRARDRAARRKGARRKAVARRDERRDVHDLVARLDRRDDVHADHQRARSGDPRRRPRRHPPRVGRRAVRSAADPAALALVRPPRRRRRERRALRRRAEGRSRRLAPHAPVGREARMSLRLAVAGVLGCCALVGFGSGASATVVSTVAGNGTPGIADGAGTYATFLFPSAVAIDAHGTIYVADAAAQRVRAISPDGTVRTLAGSGGPPSPDNWIEGGSRDGPGAEAQLWVPLGIAAAADGTVFVADGATRTIRRIAADGTVSTYARGLGAPHQLALDRDGTLYVADAQLGVMRIDAKGDVTNAGFGVAAPLGIAILGDDAGARTFFVSDERGIVMIRGDRRVRIDAARFSGDGRVTTEGSEDIGSPDELAALDERTVAYTDTRTHAVRAVTFEAEPIRVPAIGIASNPVAVAAVALVAGADEADAEARGSGFADGANARFDAPTGIAAAPDGTLVVADAGNRRIRRITGFDRRRPLGDGEEIPLPPARTAALAYRIAYVGNSFVWWDTTWPDSIGGQLERDLDEAGRSRAGRPFEVFPVRMVAANLDAVATYAETLAGTGLVDAIVLQIGDDTVDDVDPAKSEWVQPLTATLRRLRSELAGSTSR